MLITATIYFQKNRDIDPMILSLAPSTSAALARYLHKECIMCEYINVPLTVLLAACRFHDIKTHSVNTEGEITELSHFYSTSGVFLFIDKIDGYRPRIDQVETLREFILSY